MYKEGKLRCLAGTSIDETFFLTNPQNSVSPYGLMSRLCIAFENFADRIDKSELREPSTDF